MVNAGVLCAVRPIPEVLKWCSNRGFDLNPIENQKAICEKQIYISNCTADYIRAGIDYEPLQSFPHPPF